MPLVLAVAGAAALYLRSVQSQPATGSGTTVLTTPTAPVVMGDLKRVIRLGGTTAARNFAIITTPQMRGGRGSSLEEVRTSASTSARQGRGGGGGGGGGGNVVGRVGGGPGGMNMGGGGGRGDSGPGLTVTSMVAGGTIVQKGDVLVSFDSEDMRTRLEEFRTSVRQNDANMATLEADIEVDRRSHAEGVKEALADLDTANLDLKTVSVRSAIQSETYRLTAEEAQATYKMVLSEVPLMEASLKAQYKAQQLALQEGQAELKRMEANLNKMSLKAPIPGLVVIQSIQRRGSSEAAQIKVGDQVGIGQPVMQVVDLSSMMVNASVNQVNAELIRVGAKAEIRLDAFPDLVLPGEVYSVGAMTRQSRADFVKEIPVAVRLLKTDPRVIPDMSASADVVIEAVPQALVVPREAVFRDAPDAKPYVFVQDPSGWVKREVELGPQDFISTSIRSGLQAGDVVARKRPETGAPGEKK